MTHTTQHVVGVSRRHRVPRSAVCGRTREPRVGGRLPCTRSRNVPVSGWWNHVASCRSKCVNVVSRSHVRCYAHALQCVSRGESSLDFSFRESDIPFAKGIYSINNLTTRVGWSLARSHTRSLGPSYTQYYPPTQKQTVGMTGTISPRHVVTRLLRPDSHHHDPPPITAESPTSQNRNVHDISVPVLGY